MDIVKKMTPKLQSEIMASVDENLPNIGTDVNSLDSQCLDGIT